MVHPKKISTLVLLLLTTLSLTLIDAEPTAAQFPFGTIVVIQDTVPNGEPVFTFDISGPLLTESFTLDNDGASAGTLDTETFRNLPANPGGTLYTLSQTADVGFITTVECVDPTGNTTVSGASATIKLDPSDTVTCTFTSVKQATVVVVQNTVPNAAQNFGFTSDIPGGNSFTLDDDNNAALSNTRIIEGVGAGQYELSHSTIVSGYSTSIGCRGGMSRYIQVTQSTLA